MSDSGSHAQNRYDGENPLEGLLEVLPDEEILTHVKHRSKHGVDGFLDNRITPAQAQAVFQAGSNVGIALGIGADGEIYVVFDEEEDGALPDEVTELVDDHALATWISPHVGRNRLISVTPEAFGVLDSTKTGIDLDGDDEDELEILTSGHSLIPPSTIDHGSCKSSKPCDGSGWDSYELTEFDPEAPVLTEDTAREILELLGLDQDEGTTTGRNPSEGPSHSSEGSQYGDYDLPETSEVHRQKGQETLRTLQKQSITSFNILVDLLNGSDGRGVHRSRVWQKGEDGEWEMNHSLQEEIALSRLYEATRFLAQEDHEEAKAITLATFEDFADEKPEARDGRTRKWVRKGDLYRKSTLSNAIDRCDRGKFQRFLNRTVTPIKDEEDDEGPRDDGENSLLIGRGRSHVTDEMPLAALKILTGEWTTVEEARFEAALHHGLDLDPERLDEALTHYSPSSLCARSTPPRGPREAGDSEESPGPSGLIDGGEERARPVKSEVTDLCQLLDDAAHVEGEIQHEYGHALSEHVGNGTVKLAKCWSRPVKERYVYYLQDQPDPEDADEVSTMGETYDPEEADGINSWTQEPEVTEQKEEQEELMTDGGVRSHDISDTKDGGADENEDLEIYSCPIVGCERTAINDSTAIRNHVRHTDDEAHEGLILDDEMELTDRWGDFSPGVPDDPDFDAAPRFSSGPCIRPASRCSW